MRSNRSLLSVAMNYPSKNAEKTHGVAYAIPASFQLYNIQFYYTFIYRLPHQEKRPQLFKKYYSKKTKRGYPVVACPACVANVGVQILSALLPFNKLFHMLKPCII